MGIPIGQGRLKPVSSVEWTLAEDSGAFAPRPLYPPAIATSPDIAMIKMTVLKAVGERGFPPSLVANRKSWKQLISFLLNRNLRRRERSNLLVYCLRDSPDHRDSAGEPNGPFDDFRVLNTIIDDIRGIEEYFATTTNNNNNAGSRNRQYHTKRYRGHYRWHHRWAGNDMPDHLCHCLLAAARAKTASRDQYAADT
ncbi:hypothetical protein PGQ11_004009 [Apiospora arundinis]|uniref:Uncharacterized protein n=1 Tax=Apiospora arundinis TaxID=335852 RepID=A0ABR2J774_9PEZI